MKSSLKNLAVSLLQDYLYKSAFQRSFFTLIGIVFKEIRVSFRQFFTFKYPVFSLFRSLSINISSLNRIFLGRSLKYSFSFTGEDRIIESLLKPLIYQDGFYVDVGCNHPIFLSNTYQLYRKGWKGICVDANPKLIKSFERLRPRDKAICALVSETEERKYFYRLENDVLSTMDEKVAKNYENDGLKYDTVEMNSKTLNNILLENNCPKEFDLLCIDAEEFDFEVLKSVDLNIFKPNLIVIEDDKCNILDVKSNIFVTYLSSYSYELNAVVLDNLYFKRKI